LNIASYINVNLTSHQPEPIAQVRNPLLGIDAASQLIEEVGCD
jgi:hypothetical protein